MRKTLRKDSTGFYGHSLGTDVRFLRPLLAAALPDVALEQPIQGGHDGHAEQHPHNAQHPAAHGDGGQHPHAGQANGGAHQLGVDKVALQLLEDDQEDDKDERLHGRDGQDEQGAHHRTDVCAGDGDEGGDAHQGADGQGEGQAQNRHAQDAQDAQDDPVKAASHNVAVEALVHGLEHIVNPPPILGTQVGVQQPPSLRQQGVSAQQQVERKDQRQRPSDNGGKYRADCADHPVDGAAHPVGEELDGLFDGIFPVGVLEPVEYLLGQQTVEPVQVAHALQV